MDGDDEDEAAAPGDVAEEATSSKDGPSSGWADAMAKVLNKKIPQNKSTILAKNKTLEKERERKKQERLEKKMRVRKRWSIPCAVTVRWATCRMVSEHCPKSLLRLCQFWSLLHSDLEELNFFYFPVMLCEVFSLPHCFFWVIRQAEFGSRSVPVCQLKVFSFLRG